MSTSVIHPGAPTGQPGRFVGLAAAGLAVVIAIGVGFTLSQDEPASVSDVQSAHPTVSDDRRPQAAFVSERQMLRNAAIAAAALEYQEQIDYLRYRDQASADLEYQEHIDLLRYSDSNVNARINQPAFQAEADRLTAIAESMTGTFVPNNPGELARIEGLGAQVQTFVPNNPGELARIEGLGAQVQGLEDQVAVEQRLAHEFLDEQRTSSPSGGENPLEGIAE